MAAVHHRGFSRKVYLDHSEHCRTPFSTHTQNLVKIPWLALEIYPQNGIIKYALWQQNSAPDSDTLTPVVLRDHHMHHCAKFQPYRTIRGQVMAILPFCPLGPILGSPLCQRFSELGRCTPTWLVPWGMPTIGPWKIFFRFPKKSPSLKWRCSKYKWC